MYFVMYNNKYIEFERVFLDEGIYFFEVLVINIVL